MKNEMILVVRHLKEMQEKMDQYINTIPRDIRTTFFDNEYVNCLTVQRDRLIGELFNESSVFEDIFWFLYEFEAGKTPGPHIVRPNGIEFTFNYNEDFYKYLVFKE
jgi:hypothetical protein